MPVKKATGGRAKFEKWGIVLPRLPVMLCNSLPKPRELIEIRYRVDKAVQAKTDLERKERISIEAWLRDQERCGMDVLTDGEMTRGDMIAHFAGRLSGFDAGGTVRVYGNRFYRKPVIRGPVTWTGAITVETWRTTQRMSHKPLKAVLTGPYTLVDWSFDEYYDSRLDALKDAAEAVRREAQALVDAGAKIIQIDEPAISTRPEEFDAVAAAIKHVTGGLAAYTILHHAYGDLAPIWPKFSRLPVDNISLEAANSGAATLSLLKTLPADKDVTIGVIDSHTHVIEAPKDVERRVKDALKVVPAARLWLATDSGLKTRTPEEASAKMAVLGRTAAKLRAASK